MPWDFSQHAVIKIEHFYNYSYHFFIKWRIYIYIRNGTGIFLFLQPWKNIYNGFSCRHAWIFVLLSFPCCHIFMQISDSQMHRFPNLIFWNILLQLASRFLYAFIYIYRYFKLISSYVWMLSSRCVIANIIFQKMNIKQYYQPIHTGFVLPISRCRLDGHKEILHNCKYLLASNKLSDKLWKEEIGGMNSIVIKPFLFFCQWNKVFCYISNQWWLAGLVTKCSQSGWFLQDNGYQCINRQVVKNVKIITEFEESFGFSEKVHLQNWKNEYFLFENFDI